MSDAPTTKVCTRCGAEKPLEAFRVYLNNCCEERLYSRCKDCEKSWHKGYAERNPLKIQAMADNQKMIRQGRRNRLVAKREEQKAAAYLYRIFDQSGRLLYVGIANNALSRLSKHGKKPWYDMAVTISITRYGSRESAKSAESVAIINEQPLYNIAGSARPLSLSHVDFSLKKAQ